MALKDCIDIQSISLDLGGNSKEEIIDNLVQLASKSSALTDFEEVKNLLMEREGLGSTGIGHGVAVPHCKAKSIDKLHISIARTKNEIHFDSLDGNPVNIFFLLLAPLNEYREHLRALASIAKFIKDDSKLEELLLMEKVEDIYSFFKNS